MKKGIWLTSSGIVLLLIAFLGLRWAEREGQFDLLIARIDNAGPVDSALIADMLEPFFGQPLLSLDADSIQRVLSGIEGLHTVSVSFSYPHSMIVVLEPEIPAAMIQSEYCLYPVTASGNPLPGQWGADNLPLLQVEGSPDREFIASAIDLLLKRQLGTQVSVVVTDDGITVLEQGIPVILNGENAISGWKTWESIRTTVSRTDCSVDLRYLQQAVVRPLQETEV